MRTVTFASSGVQKRLRDDFVCAWKNIEGEAVAGGSNAHLPTDRVPECHAGDGEHNTQVAFLTPDGRVVHVVAGYRDAGGMSEELRFVLKLKAEVGDAGAPEAGHLAEAVKAAHERALGKEADHAPARRDHEFMTRHAAEPLAVFSFVKLTEGRGFGGGYFARHRGTQPTEGIGKVPGKARAEYAAAQAKILEARLAAAEKAYDPNSRGRDAQRAAIAALRTEIAALTGGGTPGAGTGKGGK